MLSPMWIRIFFVIGKYLVEHEASFSACEIYRLTQIVTNQNIRTPFFYSTLRIKMFTFPSLLKKWEDKSQYFHRNLFNLIYFILSTISWARWGTGNSKRFAKISRVKERRNINSNSYLTDLKFSDQSFTHYSPPGSNVIRVIYLMFSRRQIL